MDVAIILIAVLIAQSGTTLAMPYGAGLIVGVLLALVIIVVAIVAIIAVTSGTPAEAEPSTSIDGDRTQHRDTTGRFAAGSMGTLKTGQEGGTAIPEGAGSSAPGGASSPGDKAPAA